MSDPTKAELLEMIVRLQDRVDRLEGIPQGEISMTEFRLASHRGDRVTVERFWEQYRRNGLPGKGVRPR